jgi:hypothetical protein
MQSFTEYVKIGNPPKRELDNFENVQINEDYIYPNRDAI